LSAKKKDFISTVSGPVDPRGLGAILLQTRNLLRYHQRIGMRAYPDKERLAPLLRPANKKVARLQTEAGRSPASPNSTPAPLLSDVLTGIRGCAACSGTQTGPVLTDREVRCPARLTVVGDWCRANPPANTFWCDRDEDEMLWRMMQAIGEQARMVYVTNVLKCPPERDVAPSDAVQRCTVHLHREIAAVGAPVILAMGELAVTTLLGRGQSLVRVRGRLHRQVVAGRSVRIMPTFHPGFLLAHPEMKRLAWQDLLCVQRYLAGKTG